MNIEKAIEFIRINGNNFEQARLNQSIGLDFNRNEVLNGFSSLQNPDGGFPFGDIKGFPSCLSSTAMALHNLIEMGLVDSEVAGKGIKFLQNRQTKEGTWPENEKIKPLNPPFWDMPGDELTTLWLTADISDLMLRTGNHLSKNTKQYLKKNQTNEGKFEGYIHTTWIALSVFGQNGLDEKKIFSKALGYLENYEIEDWDTSCIAWCLDSMRRGNVERETPLWNKLIDQLSATQEPDGSWPSEDGDHLKARDVNSVLAAVMDIIEK